MKTLMTLILIASFTSKAHAEWFKKTVKEDSGHFYYVGVSSGKENLQEALSESYNNALAEAIKHNFGFEQRFVENVYSDLKDTSFQQESHLKTEQIQFEGVTPTRQKVESKNGRYLVYREIKYPKGAIAKERSRLKKLGKSKAILNTYSSPEAKGSVTVYSEPVGAKVILAPKDRKERIEGTTNAVFKVTPGRYSLTVLKEGYQTIHKSNYVVGVKNESTFNLLPVSGRLKLKTSPSDALVYINGRVANRRVFDLLVTKTYKVRVEHPDYFTKEEAISVLENDNKVVGINLRPKSSLLTVTTSPSGAEVFLNGQSIGTTPIINQNVDAGKYKIQVKKNGYLTERLTRTVAPNTTVEPINLSLRAGKDSDYYHNDDVDHFFSFSSGIGDGLVVKNIEENGQGIQIYRFGYDYRLFGTNLYLISYYSFGNQDSTFDIGLNQLGFGLRYDITRGIYAGAYVVQSDYDYARSNTRFKAKATGYGGKLGAKLDLSQLGANLSLFGEAYVEKHDKFKNVETNVNFEPEGAIGGGLLLGVQIGF